MSAHELYVEWPAFNRYRDREAARQAQKRENEQTAKKSPRSFV